MLMESWLLEKLGSRERRKDSYAIQHYQSDFCPKVTLKMRVKNYQIILNVYRAQKFYRIFSQASLMFSSKYEMPGIGVRRFKNKLFKCSIFTWKEHVGCVRFFILCLPLLRSRPVSSGGSLLQQVHCQENSALMFAWSSLLPAFQISAEMSFP